MSASPWLRRDLPPLKVPLAYFLAAGTGLFALTVALALSLDKIQPGYFQPRLMFLAHLFVAGFLLPVLFGVWHQLIPTLFCQRVPGSSTSHLVAFVLLLFGGIGMASHMALGKWDSGLWSSALVFYLALLWHLAVFAAALLKVKRSDASVRAFLGALLALLVAATIGLMMSINLAHPFFTQSHLQWLRVHLLFAFAGAVFLPLFGAMPRLFPMFLLTRGVKDNLLRFGLLSLWAGLWLHLYGMIFSGGTWLAWTLVLLGLVTLPIQAVRYGLRSMRPLRGTAVGLTAAGLMQLPICLVLVVLFQRDVLTHGGLTLGVASMVGFTALVILGVLLKILPFLIWLHRFGDSPGQQDTPGVEDLIPGGLVRFSQILILTGYFSLLAGLVLAAPWSLVPAAWTLAAGCGFYGLALFVMAWPVMKKTVLADPPVLGGIHGNEN